MTCSHLKPLGWLAGVLLGLAPLVVHAQGALELPPPRLPDPQFFCGYCHVLTYPNIVQKGYELWKKGKHNQTGCVVCHYPPGPASQSGLKLAHIPKKPPERFSYLALGGQSVRTRPRVQDASCMTSQCHGRPEDPFKSKRIQFTEKVVFVHQAHLDPAKQIEGQKLQCTSCHQHETERKKFEVSQASCHLCHFNKAKFNEGRARCELCHALPEKPIQTSGQKPITHKILKEAQVQCASCHFELVQGANGARYQAFFEKGVLKTAVVLGAGRIKTESCRACHDQEAWIKQSNDKKRMHEKHVTAKNARCFQCHQPILHVKGDMKKPGEDRVVFDGCLACHPEPHRFQRMLALGEKRPGVFAAPDPMYKARTNCLGCHVEGGVSKTGGTILRASAKTCVQCHTQDHQKMFSDWKKELEKEMSFAQEVEQEALEVLADVEGRLSEEARDGARELLRKARENLNIVRFGNGMHNKKYAMLLIDAAVTGFEDLIAFVEDSVEQ